MGNVNGDARRRVSVLAGVSLGLTSVEKGGLLAGGNIVAGLMAVSSRDRD